MQILEPTAEGIARAAAHLRAGGILGLPTETVYGLAADLWDERAVAAVFAAKERPLFDPLIAHLAAGPPLEAVAEVADLGPLSPVALRRLEALLARGWPGPLTVVLPRRGVPDLVTGGLPTVAVRVPDHVVAQAVLRAVGRPLVAPSANRFGRISPTTAAEVVAELGERVPYVIDGGPCAIGVESTVVAVEPDGALRLLRPGGLPAEEITRATGVAPEVRATGRIEAPGQTASHYAPARPLVLLPDRLDHLDPQRIRASLPVPRGPLALLVAAGEAEDGARRLRAAGFEVTAARSLSAEGDPRDAARNLFSALRALDGPPASTLVAEPWPDDVGLGHAINDRLRRAAAPR